MHICVWMVVFCLHIEENTLNSGFEVYLPREFWVLNAPFFPFWLLFLIKQFVLFFFEAVYIEIIFILKDNKTIESNELAILFNERLLFVASYKVVHPSIPLCSYSILSQYGLGQKFLHNKGLQQLNYTPIYNVWIAYLILLNGWLILFLRQQVECAF